MAQSPGPIEISSPPSSSHHSYHDYSNQFLQSPHGHDSGGSGPGGSNGGGDGVDDDFMNGLPDIGELGDMGLDMEMDMGMGMGFRSPNGMGYGIDSIHHSHSHTHSHDSHSIHQDDHEPLDPSSSNGQTPGSMNGLQDSNGAALGNIDGSNNNNHNLIDISSMPTHAQMQNLLGASGFRMDKQAYAAALSQHQSKQQLSRGSSGEQTEDDLFAKRNERSVGGADGDDERDEDDDDEVVVVSPRSLSRPTSASAKSVPAVDPALHDTPRARTRSVSNKRRKRDRDGSNERIPPVPPLPASLMNGTVKMEPAPSSPMGVPMTPRANGSRMLGSHATFNGTPATPARSGSGIPPPSSPELGSKAAVQRSLGVGSGSGPSGPSGPSGLKTPRKPTVAGRKRVRDDEDPSASNPSASDDENAQAEPGASTGSDSMPAPPPKRGMIFKNAFGASDVEEDGDEEDDGDDEPGSRSVSKGKKKMPSNGVGINPADGQPGGFELVDKDGDSMRRKIRIEYITDKSRRHITFSKRKAGIMKKAYELSTLTGTQVLLLVVSETGLVYTFTTAKLQPLVTKSEGKNLIQACLNAPDGNERDEERSASTSNGGSKKERPLAIRPLKLNAEETGRLAASAASAIPVPPIPEDSTPRPRKRLPSSKNRRPSKKEQAALKSAQSDAAGNPISEGNNPTSESDSQTVEVPEHLNLGRHINTGVSAHDLQPVHHQQQQQQQQQQSSHQQPMPPQQPLQHQPGAQQHNLQHMHLQTTPVSATFPTSIYHMSPGRAQINHQGGYYHNHSHSQTMMNMQPNFSYPTPPTHAPPQYLSGVHHGMGQQGFDPNHFADSNPFVTHQNGMAM